jgi:hypothetical protein
LEIYLPLIIIRSNFGGDFNFYVMQKYYVLFILVLITYRGMPQAPNWNWAVIPDSIDGYVTAADNSGNLYVAGSYQHYLNKYDASGNLLWTKTTGTTGCTAAAICIDNAGNILLTGEFTAYSSYPLYFDTIALVSLNNSRDIFTVKLDSSGNVKWAKRAGGPWDDLWGSGISTDGAGNVYVTAGVNLGNVFIFGNDTLQSPTSVPCFSLLKYDANGNEQWGRLAGYTQSTGSYFPSAEAICTDVNGNSYITGAFSANIIDFGGGITLSNTTTGYPDYFFAKYDSSGNVVWAKGATGIFPKFGQDVIMDNSGHLYTIGTMDDSTVFDTISLSAPAKCFIVKYDTSGHAVWAKNFGDHYWDGAECAAIDGNGNIFIAGWFYDQAFSFGNSVLHNMDPSQATNDVFVVKFDSLGNELWAKSAGSDTLEDVFGICVDANANAYIVGRVYAVQTFFDGIVLTDTTTVWSNSPFIARLDHCSAYYDLYADTIPHNWIAVNHASGIAPITYLWDWGDGTFSGGATPSHIYNTPGYYNICLTITDGAGCTNTYCDSSTYLNRNSANTMITVNVINQTTGQAELTNEGNVLQIFPNPTTGNIQLTISTKQNAPLRCEIINVLGEKIFQSTINNHQSPINLDVSFLAKGIYLVRVGDGKSWENKKLIIE